MSFVRLGRSQQSQGKRSVRPKKKTSAPKRAWVSTVNDLSVHKLTPEELSHRHEIHRSHNKAAAQWELKEKALRRRFRHPGSPTPLDHASLSIIREVFSDQLLLQDVLARSDRAMAVVKDLFGDAPRRQTGHPSVTMAPDCDSASTLPVVQRPDPPTSLSLLSQSMMDQQALNELEDSEDDPSDEDTCPSANFNSNVIHRRNLQKMKVKGQGRGAQRQRIRRVGHQGAGESVPVTPCTSGRAPDQAALNATAKVQRLRARQSQSEDPQEEEPSSLVAQVLNHDPPLNQSGRNTLPSGRTRKAHVKHVSESSGLDGSSLSSLSGNRSSLGLLQGLLGQVEAELDSVDPGESLGAPGPSRDAQPHGAQGLTGFSVALVSTLGRLARLLRQREEEAQREAEERRRLEDEAKAQRGLIDALTAETLALREESAALQAGLQQRTAELEQRLDTVVLALGGLGLLGTHRDHGPQDFGFRNTVCESGPHYTERDPGPPQARVSPAVLLSPPRQRDNRQHSPVVGPEALYQESPHPDTRRSCEVVQAFSSAPSLSSLPLLNLPSTSSQALFPDPLTSQFSQEAMLAQIAQLTRQNDLIRAQLNQARDLGSGGRGSPSSSTGRRGSSSGSTGRTTPHSVIERRMSGSSSTGRGSQQDQSERGSRMSSVSSSAGRGSQQDQSERGSRMSSMSSSTGRGVKQDQSERESGMSGSNSIGRGSQQDQSEGGSRMSCSSNSGRWSQQDQSERERRMSGSSSAGRGSQQDQSEREGSVAPTRGEQLIQQPVAPDAPGVKSVEQRLLELNRQSAAARSRLLELIEQQKQSASARVSPSVSPIPPSAFSPITAGGGRTPEESMLLPAQDPSPPQATGSEGRSAGVEASLLRLGGENRDGQTQVDKLRGGGGWFALSTHVR